MGKNFFAICITACCIFGIAADSCSQTAEELDGMGRKHFHKAFYELLPLNDTEGACREFSLAETLLTEAIQQEPDRVEPYLDLGRTYFVQKKYRKAAQIYKQAIDMAPERREIYLQLASALEMAGDYREALDVLKELRDTEQDKRSLTVLDDIIQRLEERAEEK